MALATSTIIALAAAAAASGAEYYNTQQTAKRQDRALANEIRGQTEKQNEANQRTAQTVNQIKASSPDAAKQSALSQYVDQLQQHARQEQGALAMPGKTSSAFKSDAASAAANDQTYGSNLANLMASIDAPALQRAAEGRAIGDLGVDLGTIDRSAQGQNYIDQLRLRSIQRNPWLDAFSSAAGAYANSASKGTGAASGAG